MEKWIENRRDDLLVLSDLEHGAAVWRARKAQHELPVRDKQLERAERVLKTFGAVDRTHPSLRESVEQEALVDGILKGDFESLIELLKRNVRLPDAMIEELPYPAMYYAMMPREGSAMPSSAGTATAGTSTFDFADPEVDVDGIASSGLRVQHFAALGGRVDVLATLATRGLDLQVLNAKGSSPFDVAAYSGWLDVLRYIWDRNSDRHAELLVGRYREGATPLHWGAQRNHPNVIAWLLKQGADPTARTKTNKLTPLHLAAMYGGPEGVAQLLQSSGIDPNAKDGTGMTALHYAASVSPLETVDLLIQDERVTADQTDDRGMMALHYAVNRGEVTIVERVLAKSGAFVNAPMPGGWTALHLAACKNMLKIVDALLSQPGIERDRWDDREQLPIELTTNPEVLARFVAAGSPPPLWSAEIDTTGGLPKLRRLDGAELRARIAAELRPDPATLEWPLRPLLAGPWEPLAREAAIEVLARAVTELPLNFGATFTAIDAVRRLPLHFYRDVTLYEARVLRGDTPAGLLTILEHESAIVVLTGTSPPIHAMNAKGLLQLDKPESMVDYLRFFCAAVHGEKGPFTLIEKSDALVFNSDVPPDDRRRVEAMARPCELIGLGQTGGKQLSAVVQHDASLFEVQFDVDPKGPVVMLDDRPLVTNLPVDTEHFFKRVRTPAGPPLVLMTALGG